MAHEQWQTQIDAYLDGELNAEAMHALDAHLRTCPACAADVLARVQLKRAVKTAGTRFTPSADFRSKIQKQIATKPRRSWNFGWTLATATLSLLLVAGAITTYIGRQNLHQQQIYSELADLHVATLGSPNPVDVVSSDRHTVKPWFQGKIPFTFNLPELQNSEFTLIGGRVAYLGQAPGAELIFQVRKHYVSVFIFQEHAAPALRSGSGVRKHVSFNYETLTEGGLRYIAISDTTGEDLSKLAELLKTAAKS